MKCAICGSTRHATYKLIKRDRYIGDRIRHVKCSKCGLVFIKPQPLKKLKKLYRREYRSKIGVLKTLKSLIPFSPRSVHLNYLKRKHLLERGKDVLDIGSGTGRLLYLLKWRGWNVLGIEPTTHYAEFANRVLKVPTINGFIEDVKLEKKFDLVIMLDVLEHIADPIKILKKVKSLMKKDGRLYIVVPYLHVDMLAAPHLFMYTRDTIMKLLNKIGFVVESIDVIGKKVIKIHLIARGWEGTKP